jgi:hypothetical protein
MHSQASFPRVVVISHLMLAAAVAAVGCGGDDDAGGAGKGGGKEDGGAVVDAATEKDAAHGGDGSIGPDGGTTGGKVVEKMVEADKGATVKSGDGVLTVQIPAGALAKDTVISVHKLARSEWPADLAALDILGDLYDIQPDGLKFDVPVAVTWSFDKAPSGTVTDDGLALLYTGLRSGDGTIEYFDDDQMLVLYGADGGLQVGALIEHLSVPFTGIPGNAFLVTDLADGQPERRVKESWVAGTAAAVFFGPDAKVNKTLRMNAVGRLPVVADPSIGTPLALAESSEKLADLFGSGGDHTAQKLPDAKSTATTLMATPKPGYICRNSGVGKASLYATAYLPDMTIQAVAEEKIECVGGAAIYMADNQHVARSEDQLVTVGGVGALANVVHPTSTVINKMSATAGGAVIYEGVPTFASLEGASPITLTSSLQTATATHDGARYAITGLTGSAVFANSDMLTVTGAPPGAASVEVTVSAPAPVDAADVFGELAGLRTKVSHTDGAFDAFAITVTLTGSSKTGDAGILRVVPASDLPLRSGKREMPILDDATIAELEDRGLKADQVYVAVINEVDDASLFPDEVPIPVQAGRSFQVDADDLVATGGGSAGTGGGGMGGSGGGGEGGSGGGGATVVQCGDFPMSVPAGYVQANQSALVLCLESDGTCFATNDTFNEGASTQCAYENTALRWKFSTTSADEVFGDYPTWEMIWSSTGSLFNMTPSGGANWVIVERTSDGARRKVDFTMETDGVEIASVMTHTGALPSVGARHDCSTAHTFGTPVGSVPHASVCINDSITRGHCSVVGDAAATALDDACDDYGSVRALDFFGGSTPNLQSGGQWTVISATRGCNEYGDLTDLPSDGSDVTAVLGKAGTSTQYQVVFDWNGTSFNVMSVTETSGVDESQAPDCPAPQEVACSALPVTLPEWTYSGSAVLCVDGTSCSVTNDINEDFPLADTQCDSSLGHRAAVLDESQRTVCADGTNWHLVWATDAAISYGCASTPLSGTGAVIVERASDNARYEIDYAFEAENEVTVTSAETFSGPLPTIGEMFDCASVPQTFDAPSLSAVEVRYAGLCIDETSFVCRVLGDTEATSETEYCGAVNYMLQLGYSNDTEAAYVRSDYFNSWLISSTTHGTITDQRRIDDLPTDGTDVTLQLDNSLYSLSYQVVLDWDGVDFTIVSVSQL